MNISRLSSRQGKTTPNIHHNFSAREPRASRSPKAKSRLPRRYEEQESEKRLAARVLKLVATRICQPGISSKEFHSRLAALETPEFVESCRILGKDLDAVLNGIQVQFYESGLKNGTIRLFLAATNPIAIQSN